MKTEIKFENGKVYRREVTRVNAGDCYYCDLPVFVSEGQASKYLVRRDKSGNTREYPTHKKCRK